MLHTVAMHGCDAVPRSNDAAAEANLLEDPTLALDCAHRSADVARSAAEICGSLPIEEALHQATMSPAAAQASGSARSDFGLR